ncbi:hypothetical protein mRhiFer1_008268 [Rhinolophus ferrumequinum]|uniref:Uncharacterized protein n=1 Tax=Rhinolophus ferrumequinum TaxID=59479 RepID=A0A7J7VQW1_RHIFE|nr:hypothetical protein mRhiFer1_008268 [Rhinolophus ferrumequinum]
MSSLSGWRKCSCASLWPDCGLTVALPLSCLSGAGGSRGSGSSSICRASFLSRNLGQPLRRAFLLAEGAHRKQGPALPTVRELRASSHALQCFLMAAGLGLRPQQDTQVLSRLFMLSLDSRISPGHKSCFLLAFSWHKIYICFYYYICSSKNGMCKNSFPSISWLFQF